ncbi:MAG TPA: LysM peptidoglycan-binding domain-containing protein [Solirubrobacterales bacterium]|nr:LysM peptidoglycan-binding domain-containing protein [Solirubrobacterales bacterium]
MKKRRSIIARLLAVLALVGAIVALVILIPPALKDNNDDSKKSSNHPAEQQPKKQRTKAKTYVVETGDTLIGIAHKTGVPISEIRALNPEIDPQILIAGETLKLR